LSLPKVRELVPREVRLNLPLTFATPITRAALAYRRIRLAATDNPKGIERLDAILVINLQARPDRLVAFMHEMNRLRIRDVQRLDAISDQMGILGCTRSHAACLRAMVEQSWNSMMVCEDDARFLVARPELDVLTEQFLNDRHAEVACLAYNHQRRPRWHSPLFFRALDTQTTACYLIKNSIASDLLHLLEKAAEQLAAGGDRMVYGVDIVWKRLQESRTFVIPTNRAVIQADGYSDIENRYVKYGV